MASLTDRAERAALGAMLAGPGYRARLGYLMADDFADERHRAVFTGITRATDVPGMSRGQYYAAVARVAGPQVSLAYLRELTGACPEPGHAGAYGAMVIQARLSRQLAARADVLAYEAMELRRDAGHVTVAAGPGGQAASHLAGHLDNLAGAFREHAARLRPGSDRPVIAPLNVAPQGTQQDYEERVLSALLQRHPDSGRIFSFLPVAAFTSDLRQELFRAIRSLDRDGRPVDALTVDWEHDQRTLQPAGTGTYTTRLASALSGDAPLKDAYALLTRLQHRTRAPAGAPPVQDRPAIAAAPEQAPRQPQLIQPPPGGIPGQRGPVRGM